jgi:hypothetical protein
LDLGCGRRNPQGALPAITPTSGQLSCPLMQYHHMYEDLTTLKFNTFRGDIDVQIDGTIYYRLLQTSDMG